MSDPPLDPSAGRILDASLNRAAEALRVVEDICRFHWNLKGPTQDIKELRHALLNLFTPDPAGRAAWCRFRDIEGDAGRGIASPPARPSASAPASGSPAGEPPAGDAAGAAPELAAVSVRNLERAKEAFRTIEEVCKPWRPELSRSMEGLRYRLYAVEKGILHLAGRREGPLDRARLCLLLAPSLLRMPLEDFLAAAIRGGVDAVQLRDKSACDRRLLEDGRRAREIAAGAGIPFIVNDRVDLALLLDADGVHLGQDDLPVAGARSLGGGRLAIGVSTHTPEQARRAMQDGADSLGIGPVFTTATKDAGPPIGPEGFREIFSEVDLPAFAIGGIQPQNLDKLAGAGADRIAVCSPFLAAANPGEVQALARGLREALGAPGRPVIRPR